MNNELLIVAAVVGPVLMAGPPLVAVWLCERHANQSAASIRAAHATPAPAQTRPAPVRMRELTR
ncbi:hypothetical protein [Micromonospora sp. NPDC001898]|uniref:hypothetical protein n=1 Tax=Micromonospora sp. NPDC001898 TaxID=3364221 RepID=UPI00367DDAB0